MQTVIIGNGIAGTLAAKTLREMDPDAGIEIFAAEPHLYYPRPNLIEFIAGSLPFDRLFAFPEKWYGQHRIEVHTGAPVEKIAPDVSSLSRGAATGAARKVVSLASRKGFGQLFEAVGSLRHA